MAKKPLTMDDIIPQCVKDNHTREENQIRWIYFDNNVQDIARVHGYSCGVEDDNSDPKHPKHVLNLKYTHCELTYLPDRFVEFKVVTELDDRLDNFKTFYKNFTLQMKAYDPVCEKADIIKSITPTVRGIFGYDDFIRDFLNLKTMMFQDMRELAEVVLSEEVHVTGKDAIMPDSPCVVFS